jgi:ketosteroid isomerase-like protein
MSAAPTSVAMDNWLAHYAPFAFFEDPTAGLSGLGHEQIRKPYVDAFTGTWGPVRWTALRRLTSGDWTAVEGWLDGTQRGKAFHTRFTTWFKRRDDKIVHQIDYVDYSTMRRQVAGEQAVTRASLEPSVPPDRQRDADGAMRLVNEFYQRYETIPALGTQQSLDHFMQLFADDAMFEDPTFGLVHDSRAKLHANLRDVLAAGTFGTLHWEIDRSVTDGEWVAVEGTWRGTVSGRAFATRFTTWLRVRGDKIVRQIDYIDYTTFRRLTSPPKTP